MQDGGTTAEGNHVVRGPALAVVSAVFAELDDERPEPVRGASLPN